MDLKILLPHTCTIHRKTRDQQLSYSDPSGTFSVGDTITGKQTIALFDNIFGKLFNEFELYTGFSASGTLKEIILNSGTGILKLSNVSGVFVDGEPISNSDGSTAIAKGTNLEAQDSYGQPSYSEISISIDNCRFSNKKPSGLTVTNKTGLAEFPSGLHVIYDLAIKFLPDADVEQNDTISTTEEKWAGSYKIKYILKSTGMTALEHKLALIEDVK